MDVTAGYRDSFTWLVLGEVQRKLMDEFVNGIDLPCGGIECAGVKCDRIMGCALRLNLSGKMRMAIDQLADLQAGRIVCTREGAMDL